jgi:preprotein translocase subunit SecE
MNAAVHVGRRFGRKKLKEFILAERAKSRKQNRIVAYFRETSGELRKVTWPTWPEAWQLTYLVLLVMLFVGIILGLTDAGAHWLLNQLLSIS